MLKSTIMERHDLCDRQDLVHRDVEKITSAVYEFFKIFFGYVLVCAVFCFISSLLIVTVKQSVWIMLSICVCT